MARKHYPVADTSTRLSVVKTKISRQEKDHQIGEEWSYTENDRDRLIPRIEEERARIARDLHDDVGQQLALLTNGLRRLHGRIAVAETSVRAEIVRLYRQLEAISLRVERISRSAHPSIVQHLGIKAAIQTECESFSQAHGIRATFRAAGNCRHLPNQVNLNLFRVTQEALQNIAKHSGAKTALVTLEIVDGTAYLRIQDWGRGCDLKAMPVQPRLGLISMHERAKLCGGRFTFRSSPDNGTLIEVLIPTPKRAGKLS